MSTTTTTPAPPSLGQDPWGAQLNEYLAYVEGRLLTVESQPNGAIMSYNFTPSQGAGPALVAAPPGFASGEIRFDNDDQTQATAVMVSTTTESGADATLALSSAVPGTVLVLQQTSGVDQYAMAVMTDDPVNNGDHFLLPISGVRLNSQPLVPGLTGLSAAGISQPVPPGYDELRQQVADLTTQVTDLQTRVAALEAVPPPIPAVSSTTVTSITPTSGSLGGGTAVTIKGTGFNSFGAYQAGLATVGSWFIMTDFLVLDDNTITATTRVAADGAGVYNLAVWFNAADAVILANAFTYT